MGFTATGRGKELYFCVGLVKFFTFFPLLVHRRPLRLLMQYEDRWIKDDEKCYQNFMVDSQLGFHCHRVIHRRNIVLLAMTQQELLLL